MARQTEAVDGHPPLNDEALQAIQHPESLPSGQAPLHVTVHRVGTDPDGNESLAWVGYAFLRDAHSDPTGSLFVLPDARRAGAGRRLLAATIEAAESSVRIWAPGNSLAARTLAASAHFVPVRELLIMARPLDTPILDPELPDGVTIRAFRPGVDDEAWVRVNARAFAQHPEQGRVSLDGLHATMAESWFDPDDFLVAVGSSPSTGSATSLLGFHWLKQHSDTRGEVYVLGVDPDHAGRGLGKALLRAGLRHLRDDLGLTEVILYVEGDNEPAVGLYVLNGFDEINRDVLYAQHRETDDRAAD
ncbi:mycothiol synthase [Microlunatus elymi]|uniref:Mycothiol acetyltransferase n=2 Tax=Microlunatus elymi TaxID=2596828 RepID=A0A516Q6F0_9ACTN|nr:mycothiol synthase [Microlunatus elymi]